MHQRKGSHAQIVGAKPIRAAGSTRVGDEFRGPRRSVLRHQPSTKEPSMTVTSHHADPAGISPKAPATAWTTGSASPSARSSRRSWCSTPSESSPGCSRSRTAQRHSDPRDQALVMGIVLAICVLVYCHSAHGPPWGAGDHGVPRGRGDREHASGSAAVHSYPVRGVPRRADVGRTRAAPSAAADDRRTEALKSVRAQEFTAAWAPARSVPARGFWYGVQLSPQVAVGAVGGDAVGAAEAPAGRCHFAAWFTEVVQPACLRGSGILASSPGEP